MSRPQTWNFEVRSLSLRDSSLPPLLKIHFAENIRIFCSKVRRRMKRERRRNRELKISTPFDFKHENTVLPGISQIELALLKDKAAASRIGVADKPRPMSALVIHPAFLFPRPESDGDTASEASAGGT